MKIVDIANEIYQDLGEPSDIGISSISMKVRRFIGDLNLLLNTSFYLNELFEIIDENNNEIDINAVAILKKKYEIYYYGKQSNTYLGAAGTEVRTIQDDGASVTTYDKNSLSKGYLEMKKAAKEELKDLINGYKVKKYTPLHIETDDKIGSISRTNPDYNGFLFNGGV